MLIHRFDEMDHAGVESVGGKGANLGELARAGFPVPPGFCVTTAAYQAFIDAAGLGPAIAAELGALPAGDVVALDEAAARIRARILSAPIPEDIATAVRLAYGALVDGNSAVAVRSSATAEDRPEASFAGQQETYLNVRGAEPVLAHVRQCWASLWTARAIAYRERNGYPHDQARLAVVVQVMVEPEVAGVLFTVNPLTGDRTEMLCNAAYGLGESVVAGRVTPDTYHLSWSPRFEVRERRRGTKEIRIRSLAEGGTVADPVAVADQNRFCLDDRTLAALTDLGRRIEAHDGKAPQDIEWALVGGRLWLLQARPITSLGPALPPPTLPARSLNRIERRMLDDILEHYPDPPYPLDLETMTRSYDALLQAERELGLSSAPADMMIRMDDLGRATITAVAPRPTWRLIRLPGILRDYLRQDPEEWSRGQAEKIAQQLERFRTIVPARLSDADLIDFIERMIDQATEIGRIRFSRYVFPMLIRGALLRLLLRLSGAARPVDEYDLLGDLEYRSLVIDQALRRLAYAATEPAVQTVLQDQSASAVRPALAATPAGQAFLDQLDAFLAGHGARTSNVYQPFSTVSWSEDPEGLLAILATMLRSGAASGESASHRDGVRFQTLRDQTAGRLPGPLRRAFLNLLIRFRAGHVVREETHYAIEETLVLARGGVRAAAQRLAERGALPGADDVVFLRLAELGPALRGERPPSEVRPLVERRRLARPGAAAAWRGPEYRVDGNQVGDLVGQSGSPGLAEGPARVIGGVAEFGKMQRGDVLVCAFTDPTWTPLFGLAAAVVSDTGGPLSHAAIVAREYGIPAVLGTRNATHRLRDGEWVIVDGHRGVVRTRKRTGSE